VKFINTDGMAFIGPGSEWFWTAASGIVLAVTFFAIYRQLRLQRSANAIEQLNQIEREYTSERLARYMLELLLAIRDGSNPADVPDRAAAAIANFWERVASLTRGGHVDLELLWDGGSAFYCQTDWVRLAPWIEKTRTEFGNPKQAEHFEWLVGMVEARARRDGIALDDAAQQAARLDRTIAAAESQLRVEQSLRTVIIASPEAAQLAPPAAAAVAAAVAES